MGCVRAKQQQVCTRNACFLRVSFMYQVHIWKHVRLWAVDDKKKERKKE